jgi:dTDP-4-amino-4,6-dideoxygalactose transaminase
MATLNSVRERWTPATRAVVFIHLYGQTSDLVPLAEWCREQNITLIEDMAQSQGAVYPDGRTAGSVGDLVVYSFNRTKILDCGGGALQLRSAKLNEAWMEIAHRETSSREFAPENAATLALSHRNLYHSLVALRRSGSPVDVATPFLSLNDAYSGLYVRSLKHSAPLAAAWETLPRIIEDRFRKAELYSTRLAGGPWRLLGGWRTSGICWRFSLLVDFPERLETFTESVRRDGFHVSNLYWPLNELINPCDRCPEAEDFARRVANLWVDASVDKSWIERCTESLWAHAASQAAKT